MLYAQLGSSYFCVIFHLQLYLGVNLKHSSTFKVSAFCSSVMHVSVICICRMPCKVSQPILPLLEMLMPHLFGSVPLSRGPQHVGLTANTVVAPCPRPPVSLFPLLSLSFSSGWGSWVSQELDETIESQWPDTTCHT